MPACGHLGISFRMVVFRRKNVRLRSTAYLGAQWYFLTLCAEGRIPRFREAGLVKELLALLSARAQSDRFLLAAYCFMPEHLHVLASGTSDDSDLLRFLRAYKQQSSYSFRRTHGQKLWQKKYYDHILRPGDRWESVAAYIWMNPVRAGLCVQPIDWPFSGSFTVNWKQLMTAPPEMWRPPWKRT